MVLAALACAAGLSLPGPLASIDPAPRLTGPSRVASAEAGDALGQDELIEAILAASGDDDPASLRARREAVQEVLAGLTARFEGKRPSYRRARKLHNILHREVLRRYDADADRIDSTVLTGRYNCVSAVLLYGLAARSLGYRPQVLAYPGHVLLRIAIGDRLIDVETTSPYGFDVGWLLHPSRHHDDETWLHPDVRQHPLESHRYGERGGSLWLVTFDAAVGFVWINEAWRALEDGESVEAAMHVLQARRYLPELRRAEGVRRLLVKAFRSEYESGRFERAYRIARADVELFPDSTTSLDRIVAAALKRIESACDADDPRGAISLLDEVGDLGPAAEFERLERLTTPMIAASAVRVGDWSLARAAAERYATVERDKVETARLREWIELRDGSASRRGEECSISDADFRPRRPAD
jgi:hypothetical protein